MPFHRRSFLAAAISPLLAPLRAAARPNVVLIVADDLGSGDLSCYGATDIRTPNIDGLARAGMRFTTAYSNGPECSPTRCALMTGRYQQRAGGLECAIGLGDVGRYDDAIWLQQKGDLGLPADEFTMPRAFRNAGYRTACFGKWHLGYPRKFWPDRHGFGESFGVLGGGSDYYSHVEPEPNGRPYVYRNGELTAKDGYLTDLFAREAIDWLRKTKQKPYFLYLPFNAPHTPIQDPDGDRTVRQGHRPTYARMVERMDARVGDILAEVDRQGAGNTIVIFISDNGADANGSNKPLRGRKSSLFEGGIRIPLLIRWPAAIKPGATNGNVALTMDLLPTLAGAAGLPVPAGRKLDGINLLESNAPRARTVFWRFKRGQNIRKAVRDGSQKFIHDGRDEFLFDLERDPLEQNNLVNDRSAADLRARLAQWERDVLAPRLKPFRSEPG
jgi:N-acetylgalactosamine-6-sulfatase